MELPKANNKSCFNKVAKVASMEIINATEKSNVTGQILFCQNYFSQFLANKNKKK